MFKIREPTGIELIRLLKKGANVSYLIHMYQYFLKSEKYKFDLKSINLTPKSTATMCVACTNHSRFDYSMLQKMQTLVNMYIPKFKRIKAKCSTETKKYFRTNLHYLQII